MVMSMKGDEILGRYIKVSLESMASGFSLLWGDVMYLHRHKRLDSDARKVYVETRIRE